MDERKIYSLWLTSGLKKPGKTGKELASKLGRSPSAVSRMASGEYSMSAEDLRTIALYIEEPIPNVREVSEFLGEVSRQFDVSGISAEGRAEAPPRSNAELSGPISLDSAYTIPVYGQAIGGDDGQFVMNGNHMADVLAPPALRGVRGAYGVYVTGESMEPRYFAGEVVYVDPTRPVRRGDFAVVQIYGDDEDTVSAYVKRFISSNSRELVLEQYNPPKQMRFDASRVKSVHRIVMGGDG